MDLRLEGKVALATGGSRSIGRGIAAGFTGEGATAMIVSRNAEAHEEASGAIETHCQWIVSNALGSWVTGQTIAVARRGLVALKSEPTI